jgi:hypothetical protein
MLEITQRRRRKKTIPSPTKDCATLPLIIIRGLKKNKYRRDKVATNLQSKPSYKRADPVLQKARAKVEAELSQYSEEKIKQFIQQT